MALEHYNNNRNKIARIYALAQAYENTMDYYNAYVYYQRADSKQKIKKINVITDEVLQEDILRVSKLLKAIPNESEWKYDFLPVTAPIKFQGKCFQNHDDKIYCVGNMKDWWAAYYTPEDIKSWLQDEVEIYEVADKSVEYTVSGTATAEFLVPVLCNVDVDDNEVLILKSDGTSYNFISHGRNRFQYFRLEQGDRLLFDLPAIIAKPIPLCMNQNKKKLVVNLFIDSFNASLLEEEEYRQCIPNIIRYFEQGVICTNAYAGSEFTFPSMPSYMLSLYPEHHQMLDDSIYEDIPTNVPALAELFHDAGYTTSKIGGNDSTSFYTGFSRGIDRTVYYLYYMSEQLVADTIEDIEAFKDSNHFVTVEFLDLHHVSSGFLDDIAIQAHTLPGNYVVDCTGPSTVKRSHSPHRMEIYKQVLRKIDRNLEMLFHYIEQNYQEEEVLISLFSDHGTAIAVSNDRPFLDETRVHVPFMFRSSGYKGKCEELIETVDYLPIMCTLAQIDYDHENIDGRIPKFFGGDQERDYVFARSIYKGDPYRATLIEKNRAFYLETVNQVSPEMETDLSEVVIRMDDRHGREIEDTEFEKKCIEIVKERQMR